MEPHISAGAFLGRVTAMGVAASACKVAEAACDKYVAIMKKESGVNEDNITCEVKRYNPGPSMGVGPTLMKVSESGIPREVLPTRFDFIANRPSAVVLRGRLRADRAP
jgi:hypothetical protein